MVKRRGGNPLLSGSAVIQGIAYSAQKFSDLFLAPENDQIANSRYVQLQKSNTSRRKLQFYFSSPFKDLNEMCMEEELNLWPQLS